MSYLRPLPLGFSKPTFRTAMPKGRGRPRTSGGRSGTANRPGRVHTPAGAQRRRAGGVRGDRAGSRLKSKTRTPTPPDMDAEVPRARPVPPQPTVAPKAPKAPRQVHVSFQDADLPATASRQEVKLDLPSPRSFLATGTSTSVAPTPAVGINRSDRSMSNIAHVSRLPQLDLGLDSSVLPVFSDLTRPLAAGGVGLANTSLLPDVNVPVAALSSLHTHDPTCTLCTWTHELFERMGQQEAEQTRENNALRQRNVSTLRVCTLMYEAAASSWLVVRFRRSCLKGSMKSAGRSMTKTRDWTS